MALFASWARRDGVSTEMLLFLRFGIAGSALAAWMLITRARWPRGRDLLLAMIMGAVLYAGMSTCYFHGLRYIPAGLVALLLYLYPVIVTILARLGIVLGVGCALCYSLYIIIGGPITRRVGAIPASTIVMLAAASVFGAITLPRGDTLPTSTLGWTGALGLAVFCTLLAITTFLAGLKRVGPVLASTLSTLEAVTTVIVGAACLSDTFKPIQVIGGALILIAAVMIARTQ